VLRRASSTTKATADVPSTSAVREPRTSESDRRSSSSDDDEEEERYDPTDLVKDLADSDEDRDDSDDKDSQGLETPNIELLES